MKNKIQTKLLVQTKGDPGRESTCFYPWALDDTGGLYQIEVLTGAKFLSDIGNIYLRKFILGDSFLITPKQARDFARALNFAADRADEVKGGE